MKTFATDDDNTNNPDPEQSHQHRGLSRRSLLFGGGLVGAAALVGTFFAGRSFPYGTGEAANAASDAAPKIVPRSFVSTQLTAPPVSSWKHGDTAAGYLFVEPQGDGFNGLILQDSGEPIWIEPTRKNLTDLRVQRFEGKPVLTYWSGKSTGGHGAGSATVLDTSYRTVATVDAGNGLQADLHEFNLTDRGTALITIYNTEKADLSSIGGPKDGYVYNCHVQEIDVRSGAVLLDWNALEHVDIAETYLGLTQDEGHDGKTPGRAFDAYHLNAVDDDGDALYISARHTHAIYKIDRGSGAVLWRWGGRRSDISVASDAVFAWQHDVRHHVDGTISLFDNHLYSGTDGVSSAMFFTIDEQAGTSTLVRKYSYARHLGTAMGSAQLLENGNVLVGWGTDASVTEFASDGTAVFEADLTAISYRANRAMWKAQPATLPDVGVKPASDGRLKVHASWNGATGVHRWRVLTGTGADTLTPVKTVHRSGFETSTLVTRAATVAVQALDATGAVLATSAPLTI